MSTWCSLVFTASGASGTIDAKGVAQRLDDLREAIQANAVMCKTAEAYVQDHMLELSEHTPAMVVGNGPNYGVAEEAALKLSEDHRDSCHASRGRGVRPRSREMQIVPGYLVFIVDDPQGSERLAISLMRYRTLRQKRCCSRPIPRVGLTRLWCLRLLCCSAQFPI